MTLDTALLEFETLTACPICGGTDIPGLVSIRDLGIDSGYSNCQRCGQLFLNPRMSDEQTVKYYAGMYRDGLMSRSPGFMENDTNLQKSRAAAQMPFIKAIIGDRKSAIDIGCSLGYLLQGLEGLGLDVLYGIEPDTRYHDYFPANRYWTFDDISEVKADKTFDIVTLSHSLEHLNRPREFLIDLLEKHAHQDTIVMVDVPNTETHRGSYRIHHPYAFTPFTLQGLFARIGWATVQMSFYGLEREGPEKKYMIGFFKRA